MAYGKFSTRNTIRYRRTGYQPGGTIGLLSRIAAARRIQRAARIRLSMGNRRGKTVRSGGGITTQHDQRRVYSKKSMPKAKKMRWKGFIKKVNAVSEKELGSRQVVFNKSIQYSNTDAANHVTGSLYLYPQKSTSTIANDLQTISKMENEGNPTATDGGTVSDSTKYMFQSAILDITFCNHSTIRTSDTTYVNDNRLKLEVDVYECLVRRTAEETGTTKNTFEELLNDNGANTNLIGAAGSINGTVKNEISYQKRGVTPWELSYTLSRWGVKILKKTKYMVPQGDTFTYQVRDPKRHTLINRDMDFADGFNRVGLTRVIYFVAKLVPGIAVGEAVNTAQEVIDIGVTRKYFYKVEGINDDRTCHMIY